MTHFPVVVCVDDPDQLESALAPFDENITETWHPGGDVQAKWDWWVTGGRWGGYFRYRPEHASLIIKGEQRWSSPEIKPGHCDGGPKFALDLDGMRSAAAAEARDSYAAWLKIITGTPEAIPWTKFRERISGETGYTAERARDEYHAQPRVKVLKGTEFDWFSSDAIEELQVSEEIYVERARAGAVPGWAILTLDGRWMEQGQMGWWAMSDDTEASRIGFWEASNAYIDSLPDATFLIAVDCHI